MRFFLLFLFAGLICNLWPFSNRHMQRNSPTFVPQTTMDSLEAHVWRTDPAYMSNGRITHHSLLTFYLFKQNIMYSRDYTYDGTWGPVRCEPFYFYSPGVEDRIDTVIQWGDTIRLFNYARIEQTKSGRHMVYDYASISKHDKIISSRKSTGLTTSAISLTIVTLSDSTLELLCNDDFTNKDLHKLGQFSYHAIDKPFPWDKNLKEYQELPIQEKPPFRGIEKVSPLGYDEEYSIRIR